MHKLLVFCIAMFLMAGFAFAQDDPYWEFEDVVINGYNVATDEGAAKVNLPGFKNPYSVAVDPDGKVWAGTYFSRRLEDTAGQPDWERYPDLILDITEHDTGTGVYYDTAYVWNKPIWVLDTDGSIDTIRFVTLPDQSIDTLTAGHRGMGIDHDGNVIVGNSGGDVYKINYQTYEVIAKYNTGGSNGRMGVDAEGFVFQMDGVFASVVNILDPDDWSSPYNTITIVPAGVTRGGEVSPDGKDYFICSSGGGVVRYHSDDGVDGTYAVADTLYAQYDSMKLNTNTAVWHPSGLLWIGSYDDVNPAVIFAVDPDQGYAIVDSLHEFVYWSTTDFSDTTTGGYHQPNYLRVIRDSQFSSDGNFWYAADYYSYSIKKWKYIDPTGIRPGDDSKVVPGTFTLHHNYPNPFNPTTIIPFDLHKQAHVKLKVYDSLGREIGVFINQEMKQGSHKFEFDGSNLATGTYYFKLTVDTKVATGKMMLIK